MQEDLDVATPRRTPARVTVVALLVAVVGFHLVSVTAAALPPNRYSEAVRPATGYLGAYFDQNWRLFAPNPISADRVVRFQGAYEQDGEVVTTDWVDWTSVELDLVRHRLVGGRAGYVSNKAYGPLVSRYAALGEDLQAVVDVAEPQDAPAWADLPDRMTTAAGGDGAAIPVATYLAYDRAFTQLGTEVLEGRLGRPLVAVRYATSSQGVTPWEARHGSASEREADRPAPIERTNGWRQPLRGDAAEQRAVADFDRRHR